MDILNKQKEVETEAQREISEMFPPADPDEKDPGGKGGDE